MPADPVELQVLTALKARLANIRTANGYFTEAGANILPARVFDEAAGDTAPALVVWPVKGSPASMLTPQVTRKDLTLVVEGIVEVAGEDLVEDAIRVAEDIQRAAFGSDPILVRGTLGLEVGDVEYFPPEEGSRIATGQVTLVVPVPKVRQG